jgi:hypothetical protein
VDLEKAKACYEAAAPRSEDARGLLRGVIEKIALKKRGVVDG